MAKTLVDMTAEERANCVGMWCDNLVSTADNPKPVKQWSKTMSGIIKDAKKLLDGATPGPWELIGGEIYRIHHTPEQCTRIRCDHRWPVLSESWGESGAVVAADEDLALMAAVPEMAQALAEDSYEYIVQVHCEGRWQFYIGESIRPTDKPGLAVGFLQEKYAREFAKIETKRPTRIVRRRVSPPEVINE